MQGGRQHHGGIGRVCRHVGSEMPWREGARRVEAGCREVRAWAAREGTQKVRNQGKKNLSIH